MRLNLTGCRRLLATLRAKFEAAGGAIREHTAFRTADIYPDAVSIRWGLLTSQSAAEPALLRRPLCYGYSSQLPSAAHALTALTLVIWGNLCPTRLLTNLFIAGCSTAGDRSSLGISPADANRPTAVPSDAHDGEEATVTNGASAARDSSNGASHLNGNGAAVGGRGKRADGRHQSRLQQGQQGDGSSSHGAAAAVSVGSERPGGRGPGSAGGMERSVVSCRLLIDCMGHYSPIVQQVGLTDTGLAICSLHSCFWCDVLPCS